MRKEYDLQTDVLATIVAATSVTKNHSDLLTAFATRTDYRSARYVMTRDVYSERPARILDAEDREIAADYHAWIDAQLEAHGGSVRAVWEAYRNAGYRLTEIRPLLHYFVHDRGGEQDNFGNSKCGKSRSLSSASCFRATTVGACPGSTSFGGARPGWPSSSAANRACSACPDIGLRVRSTCSNSMRSPLPCTTGAGAPTATAVWWKPIVRRASSES